MSQNMPYTPTALLDTSHVRQESPLIIIDGSPLVQANFYRTPRNVNDQEPIHYAAVNETLNTISSLVEDYQAKNIVVVFDSEETTPQQQINPNYKADIRKNLQELSEQTAYTAQALSNIGIKTLQQNGIESEDIISSLAHQACYAGKPVLIISEDTSFCQLVNHAVVVENAEGTIRYDKVSTNKILHVEPEQVLDYLAIKGDTQKGVEGVIGVNDFSASLAVDAFGGLDGIYQSIEQLPVIQKTIFEQNKEQLYKTKEELTHNTLLSTPPAESFTIDDNLFNGYLKSKNQNSTTNNRTTITTPAELNDFLEKLKNNKHYSIMTFNTHADWEKADIVGFGFALNKQDSYYIPIGHKDENGNLQPCQLDAMQVLSALKPILENPNIVKIGHNIKHEMHMLKKYNIDTMQHPNEWVMDTMLAGYVDGGFFDKGQIESVQYMVKKQHQVNLTPITKVLTDKDQTFDTVAIDTVADYAHEITNGHYHLSHALASRLREYDPRFNDNPQKLLKNVEIPIASALARMEHQGIMVNVETLKELQQKTTALVEEYAEQIYKATGQQFNINSPEKLAKVLFEDLKIKGERNAKGKFSTKKEILEKIDHPVVDLVLKYREANGTLKNFCTPLLELADQENRVHTNYNQATTATTRLSSSKPNLQNIPSRSELGGEVRASFIAPAGKKILSADYSQAELRLMAHFSQDQNLINAFVKGEDIHQATAAQVLGKSINEVTSEERRQAKAVNFGLLYGMTEIGLAKKLGGTVEEARNYTKQYFEKYPAVVQYMQNAKQQATNFGYVNTILGRPLYTPEARSNDKYEREGALRAAINAPLQGSSADMTKLAMIEVNKRLPHDSAKMLLQIHDELVFEVDEDKVDEVARIIKESMENVFSKTAADLGYPLNFSVPVVADVEVGTHWGNTKQYEPAPLQEVTNISNTNNAYEQEYIDNIIQQEIMEIQNQPYHRPRI